MKYLGKRANFDLQLDVKLVARLRSSKKQPYPLTVLRSKSIENRILDSKSNINSKNSRKNKSTKSASIKNNGKIGKIFRFDNHKRKKIPIKNIGY